MTSVETPPAPEAPPTPAAPGVPNEARVRTRRLSPLLVVALAVLAALVVMAAFAPAVAPFDPNDQELTNRYAPPDGEHWLGTDALGRDQLSRLIFGTRVTIVAIVITLAVGIAAGVPAGIAAGYRRGAVDAVLTRIFDGLLSVPGLVLAMTFIAVVGAGLTQAMIAVGLMFSPMYFRLARAATVSVTHEPFIEASRSIGCSPLRVVRTHMLPNVLPPLLVQVAAMASRAVSAEASLSFLGFGVQRPTASWGAMLSDGAQNVMTGPYLVYAPGIAIAVTVLALSVVTSWINGVITQREQR